jgi:uncharacterized protein YPO0396
MPFAGELLQVRDDERDWEGAAERLLRNFGLSMLVPDAHYPGVADLVDRRNLGGRLVYFRVRPRSRGGLPTLYPQSLARKLVVKPDSPFYDWLEREVAHRFDFACCMSQEEFRRETRAITRRGQIKAQGERHEKDDRHRIDDRSRFVLGWSNEAKIEALEGKQRLAVVRVGDIGQRIAVLQREQRDVQSRLVALARLEEYQDFRDQDWQPLVADIARLEDERRALEASSDRLQVLAVQLDAALAAIEQAGGKLDELKREHAKNEQQKSDAESLRGQVTALFDASTVALHEIRSHSWTACWVRPTAHGRRWSSPATCWNANSGMN